jgi:two-component system chemotaxis response regulator CheB
MVVDDSAVVRGLIVRMLEKAGIEVIASVADGQQALRALDRHDPDVVVLDIEMPVMDGLTALPQLIARNPGIKVIMASTLTEKNASISLKAMQLGAADYIPKPTTARDISGGQDFQRELVAKVLALAGKPADPARADAKLATPATGAATFAPTMPASGTVKLRPETSLPVKIIAIGSSTGGPQALFEVVRNLKGLQQPIVITQHMPPTFTRILAANIERQTGVDCSEASEGDRLAPGKAFVAPGDFHMTIDKASMSVRLTQTPPENFCRPSVDPMFRSVAAFGSGALGVVLTGMGHDGREGARAICDAAGMVIAQDEATSVVWGMPGAVALAGLASRVLPVGEIGPYLRRRAGGR